MKNQLILKNKLKKVRARRKISQQELADIVGVSRNTISSLETGQYEPTAKLALVLAIAFRYEIWRIILFLVRNISSNVNNLIDWNKVYKEEYSLTVERSAIKDTEIKVLIEKH